MYILLVSALCSDGPFSDEDVTRQNKLMKRFFEDVDERHIKEFRIFLSRENKQSYCFYKGISCEQPEKIVKVNYYRLEIGQFHLDSLPPNVKYCSLNRVGQKAEFHTRTLPRELEYLDLRANAYYGRLYLENLPLKIEKVDLQENCLTGPISLIGLPRTLKQLQVQSNKIRQNIVWYDTLPENIEFIRLINRGEKKVIGQVHATHPAARANPNVFVMMPKEMVE